MMFISKKALPWAGPSCRRWDRSGATDVSTCHGSRVVGQPLSPRLVWDSSIASNGGLSTMGSTSGTDFDLPPIPKPPAPVATT